MTVPMGIVVVIVIVASGLALAIGWFLAQNATKQKLLEAEKSQREAEERVSETERAIEAAKKEAKLEAKEEAHRLRQEIERENRERRVEIGRAHV